MNTAPLALFDMDGTLVGYDEQLLIDLNKLAAPEEAPLESTHFGMAPHLEARRHMITSQMGWWLTLKPFKLGWDILHLVKDMGFRVVVLTKGPSSKPSAWSEKVQWYNTWLKSLAEGLTITHNKGLVYGKVLVDDYPPYIEQWLEWRPRGLVIMPAHPFNADFTHPSVIRYDGTNIEEVKKRLEVYFPEE